MKILIKIAIFFLKIIYFILKLFPAKNRITFISRQSNTPSVDCLLLKKELEKKYEVVVLFKMIDSGIVNKIKYVFHMFKQMYYIATSKVVILDTYCICISVLKHKKSLKVIQMWHALGAYKKFGKSILGKEESEKKVKGMDSGNLAAVMQMHNNYDYIFASSDYSRYGFADAFGYPIEYLKVYPLPRLDLIIDKSNRNKVSEKIYKKYPSLKRKKSILYCPTFRKNGNDLKYIKELIEKIDYKKYNLILKLHPLTNYDIKSDKAIIDKSFDTYQMGFVADYIITDYSAVIFELSLLKKPIYIYAYDKKEYINNRDFYLNFDTDMPCKIYTNIEKLLENLDNNNYDYNRLEEFRKKYVSDCKISYTYDIVKFIENII